MRPGEIVLLRLPQADLSSGKLRPVLVLSDLPGPFGDYLVCGISSQLHQEMPDWDERLTASDDDFAASGLKVPSVIRLNWLAAVNPSASVGTLGSIASERLARLRRRLAAHLS
jgi:mRNA interferase MazF